MKLNRNEIDIQKQKKIYVDMISLSFISVPLYQAVTTHQISSLLRTQYQKMRILSIFMLFVPRMHIIKNLNA